LTNDTQALWRHDKGPLIHDAATFQDIEITSTIKKPSYPELNSKQIIMALVSKLRFHRSTGHDQCRVKESKKIPEEANPPRLNLSESNQVKRLENLNPDSAEPRPSPKGILLRAKRTPVIL